MKSALKILAVALLLAVTGHSGWASAVTYTLTAGPLTFWSAGTGPNTLQFTAELTEPPTDLDLKSGIPFYSVTSSFNTAAEPTYAPLKFASTTGPLSMYTVWFWGGDSSSQDELYVGLENPRYTFFNHFYFAPLSLSHNGTYNAITTGGGLAGVLTVSGFPDASAVPEPASVMFCVTGLAGLVLMRRRKTRRD